MAKKLDISHFAAAMAGRKAPILDEIDWVKNNLSRDVSDVPPDDPPSMFSVVLLNWANENLSAFLDKFVTKLIPDKRQLEFSSQAKDDGRQLEMLQRLEEEFYSERSTGVSQEPGVPPGDYSSGQREQDSG